MPDFVGKEKFFWTYQDAILPLEKQSLSHRKDRI